MHRCRWPTHICVGVWVGRIPANRYGWAAYLRTGMGAPHTCEQVWVGRIPAYRYGWTAYLRTGMGGQVWVARIPAYRYRWSAYLRTGMGGPHTCVQVWVSCIPACRYGWAAYVRTGFVDAYMQMRAQVRLCPLKLASVQLNIFCAGMVVYANVHRAIHRYTKQKCRKVLNISAHTHACTGSAKENAENPLI